MRIVYLNPCGQMGGAETSLRELLAAVRAAQPDWQLWLILGEDGPLARTVRQLGVNVIVEPFPTKLAQAGDRFANVFTASWQLANRLFQISGYARRLARTLRRLQPDLIHTNGFKMHLLGSLTRPAGTPVIWHIHDYVGSRVLMNRLLRFCAPRPAAVITNSNSVAADFKTLFPALTVATIYNAIDLKRFSPVGNTLDLDELSDLPAAAPGTLRVGLIGTFARWKGHFVFLKALSRVSADLNIRGYIIGGPIYQTAGSQWAIDELREEAERLGISARVGFTDFLENIPDAMRSLDVVVHASTSPEPFGMVIIEGMACERAVIASRAGGSRELITEGENALAHEPGDVAALAGEIERLAKDDVLRGKLGRAGRNLVEKQFHGERLAEELLGLYESVSHRGGTPKEKNGANERVPAAGSIPAPERRG